MMSMPKRGPSSSLRRDWGLSRIHARTVLLLVVVGRVARGGGEPDLNRRIGGTGLRHAVPSAPHRSCMDMLNSSVPKLDGFFFIDPDGWSTGTQGFQVLCRLNSTHSNPGTTVVRTVNINNSAVNGNSSVTITYDGVRNENPIRALIDISDRCRQYLQYRCGNSPIRLNGVQQVAWVSWDGRSMSNWGGVETGDDGRCACSLDASCIGGGNCNCDVLSPPGFYTDSGYITNKDTLPVVGLRFNYHEGYFGTAFYTVGDLECFGRRTTTTTEATSTQEPSTTPTESITTGPPITTTEPLMTSESTEPVTTSVTTESIMSSIAMTTKAMSTQEPSTTATESITTDDRTTTAKPTTRPEPLSTTTEPVTTSVTTPSIMTSIGPNIPNPPTTSVSPDESDLNVDFSDIEDALNERLEQFKVWPGNTPIESLTTVSKDILDKTFGHPAMQDNPGILTEITVTALLENSLAKIVGGLRSNETLEMTVDDAVVQAKSFRTSEDFGGYVFKAGQSKQPADKDEEANGATLEISTGSIEDINGSFSVLVVYRDSSNTSEVANLVEDDSSNGSSYVNSGILTCSVLAQGESLEIALKFSLRHKPYSPSGEKTVHRLCSFWNNSQKVWSTKGCTTEAPDTTSSFTTCSCNHNTSFAILMRVTDSPVSQQGNADDATTLLSIILGSLSILCLCMGLALYTYLRLFKFLQIKVHANLMGSLLIGQIIFLTGIDATENPIVCKSVTVLVQFFFSGTFCWMLVEGGLLFQRAKMVSKQQPKILLLMVIGWGVPFLITMISFAVGFEDYGTDEPFCWLSTKRGRIWAFVSLVIVVVLVNLGIIVMVMRTFMSLKMYTDKDNADKIRASFRAMVVLVPILGLTWVFGFLQSASVAFNYLFVIFNSSQGMLVFICHVVMNGEVQKALKRRGKNKVSASTASSCGQSDTQMTTRRTNTTSATAF